MNIILKFPNDKFETTIDTLTKIPYFRNMFEQCGNPLEKCHPIIFMNRSSRSFSHILDWALDDHYPYPKKYEYELDFYMIDKDCVNIYDKNDDLAKKIQLQDVRCNVIGCNNPLNRTSVHCENHNLCVESGCKNIIHPNIKWCKSHCRKSICNRRGCNNAISAPSICDRCLKFFYKGSL